LSVLTLPRIHFIGVTDWDPSTGNNAPSTYDEATVQPQLGPPDVYYSNFLQWLKQSNGLTGDNEQPNGSWNIYGDHSVHFRQTSVSRAELESGDAPGDDPFLGQPVDILGENYHDPTRPARMVMTDPFTGGEATSQIFYKWLVAGVTEGPDNSKKIGFKATAACRLFSRSPCGGNRVVRAGPFAVAAGSEGCLRGGPESGTADAVCQLPHAVLSGGLS